MWEQLSLQSTGAEIPYRHIAPVKRIVAKREKLTP